MKSILFTLVASAALVSCAPPSSNNGPRPASSPEMRFAEASGGGSDGGHAEGWGPGGDYYDAHGPFPSQKPQTATGGHGVGWGPGGDYYDARGPFPTTGSMAGSDEPTATPA